MFEVRLYDGEKTKRCLAYIQYAYTKQVHNIYAGRRKRPAIETKLLQELGLPYTAVHFKIVYN